ncbi:ABC transporter permease [Cellulomonas fengjieae]|uniref:Autoinducer 2 import system permease protein LsrD n=1 Tax=Cellulomonas fengjieae TaxID=2819978 RepID=A0ABS3SIE6_9CELL|nr:ABC transporter permease [Cellulomonas fengjieae]MBO3084740.1 ABC transporter permease [Cellulomonas fengjieae]QVI66938.1 ABC transporter permease [Cellulomonas fengjieae]
MTALALDTGIARVRDRIGAVLSGKGIFIALAVVLVVAAIVAPNFYAQVNVSNTLRRASILGLVTIGQLVVLMVRNVDLSVAAMIGITAVLLSTAHTTATGLVMALLLAVVVGAANTWLVVRRGVPAFVATFGMVMVLQGGKLIWTQGSTSGESPAALVDLARGSVGPVPTPFLLWLLVTIALSVWISSTRSGRNVVVAGANPTMARLSGINVGKIQWLAFTGSAVLAVLAGALLTGFSGYVDRSIGTGYELDSITAALLGGARFKGGEGSFVGAMGGVLVLAALDTLIVVLGLRPELQDVIKGVVLILALTLHWPDRR